MRVILQCLLESNASTAGCTYIRCAQSQCVGCVESIISPGGNQRSTKQKSSLGPLVCVLCIAISTFHHTSAHTKMYAKELLCAYQYWPNVLIKHVAATQHMYLSVKIGKLPSGVKILFSSLNSPHEKSRNKVFIVQRWVWRWISLLSISGLCVLMFYLSEMNKYYFTHFGTKIILDLEFLISAKTIYTEILSFLQNKP